MRPHLMTASSEDPYPTDEMVKRLRRLFGKKPMPPVVEFGNVTIDNTTRTITIGKEPVLLTKIEFELAYCLAVSAGEVVGREQLKKAIWGKRGVTDHSLDVHVYNLRKKLDAAGQTAFGIEAVRAVGFMLAIRHKQVG